MEYKRNKFLANSVGHKVHESVYNKLIGNRKERSEFNLDYYDVRIKLKSDDIVQIARECVLFQETQVIGKIIENKIEMTVDFENRAVRGNDFDEFQSIFND